MPRSANIRRVNPEVASDVLNVLLSEGKEFKYDEDKGLAVFIKKVTDKGDHKNVDILIDYNALITRKVREGGEVKTWQETVPSVVSVRLALFSEVRGSGVIENVAVLLSSKSISRLLAYALERIVGKTALLRVKFDFSYTKQQDIVNQFDDIVRITSDDVDDARIIGLSLKGHSLYGSYEFQKAFTGKVRYIGVRLGNEWFLVASDGRITTYRPLGDDVFIEKIILILRRLLAAQVVVI